jgi:(1->4)-alpha-D-glucan 1-alpha-D-glucosylmutase
MVTTATHDTKRDEDVRARLALLSEQPGLWFDAVHRWSALTSSYHTGQWPDRNAEYLFYQTLVGAWPVCVTRMTAYMEKASREAKVHTLWTSPNAEYDDALRAFVEGCLHDRAFTEDVSRFVEPLVQPGRINSLSQTLLKLTSPGVPDVYQGTELWSLRLVDPDNRRPVDYLERRRALAEVKQLNACAIWRRADEGLPKMWVTHAALQLRQRRASSFGAHGRYTAIHADGPLAAHVVAFQRGDDVLTVAPRLVIHADGRWRGTSISVPPGSWRNVLTGQSVAAGRLDLATLWQEFPVALLERAESRGHT